MQSMQKIKIYRNKKYLKIVRTLPCKKCGRAPAGTAHHVYKEGYGLKCDDRDTIPLCIDCHVMNGNSVEKMSYEELEVEIGMPLEDAIIETMQTVNDKIEEGFFAY